MNRPSMDPRMSERRLRAGFLALVKFLPTRPEPRHIFDNVARASNPLPPKGSDLADVYQRVMKSAIDTKDPKVVERTQAMIIAFHDELLAQGLAHSPLLSAAGFEETACHAMHDTAEALSAIGAAGTMRSESAIEVAVQDAEAAIISLEVFREEAHRIPRSRQRVTQGHRH